MGKSFPCPFFLCSLLPFSCISNIVKVYIYKTKRCEKEEDEGKHDNNDDRRKEDDSAALPSSSLTETVTSTRRTRASR